MNADNDSAGRLCDADDDDKSVGRLILVGHFVIINVLPLTKLTNIPFLIA